REFQGKAFEDVLARLRVRLDDPAYRTEHVSALMVEVQRDLRRTRRAGRGIASAAHAEDKATEVRRLACLLELDHIQDMYEAGRIDRATAKMMRENVNLMQLDLEDRV
ncbi:MAG: sodium:proton antiporter, partial [Slackia piriformis]|nr:sodium:proton antiporter [Slackia piriformis]